MGASKEKSFKLLEAHRTIETFSHDIIIIFSLRNYPSFTFKLQLLVVISLTL